MVHRARGDTVSCKGGLDGGRPGRCFPDSGRGRRRQVRPRSLYEERHEVAARVLSGKVAQEMGLDRLT